MEEDEIQSGDKVEAKPFEVSGFRHLKFKVDEIQTIDNVRMACGPYGCISCELLLKINPNPNNYVSI